jgi:hypothetical protein
MVSDLIPPEVMVSEFVPGCNGMYQYVLQFKKYVLLDAALRCLWLRASLLHISWCSMVTITGM